MRKILLRFTIIIFLILGVFVSVPLILSVLNRGEIAADIHKIEKASSPYLYKYHSSTFELLAGEKEDKPRLTLVQGKRSLDINVKPAVQKPAPKPTQKEPAPTTQPQGTEEPAPATETTEPEPVEAAPDETSFLPIGTAHASDSVKVINPNTKPAIEYVNGATSSNFLITPNQQKVALTFKIESPPKQLPSLNINPEKLVPRQNGEEIIFYTRTQREAFSLKNASITDKKGAKTQVRLILDNISYDHFNINFSINSSWLTDKARVFPLILKVDTVSLFHERLISASPVKADFAATEKPEFIINVSEVEEPLRSALINRNYSNLKFGAIDARGQGRRIPAELVNSNGRLVLKFNNGGSYIKPGLFDLLVQYGDDPSFIGEEEFSWGVLAINPDMAVYPVGSMAQLDMAVLDELGRVICDAALVLEITDPAGGKTFLSTADSSIKITEGCSQLVTDLPDYTTTYKTGATGNYQIRLTATTQNGQFIINDSFSVDPNSPFYVKRLGPTRIYPPKTYTMKLEIEAHKSAKSVIETLPPEFEVRENSDFTLNGEGKQTLTWKELIEKGETYTLSYQFNGPNIYPALFFVGPLKIGTWEEPRVWQIAIDDNDYIDPNGDGSVTASQTTCGGGGNYDCLDEQTRSPTSPSEAGDYLTFSSNNTDFYEMTTLSVSQVTQIDVYVYHIENSVNMYLEVSLFDTDEITQYGSSGDLTQRTAAQWDSVSFSGLTLTQGQLDTLNVRLRCYKSGSGGPTSCVAYAVYGYVTYSPPSAGPTNDQLMRHGKWFNGTAEQPMTF